MDFVSFSYYSSRCTAENPEACGAFFPADKLSLFTVDDPPLRCTLAAVYKRSGYLSSGAHLFIQELKEFVQQHSAYNG